MATISIQFNDASVRVMFDQLESVARGGALIAMRRLQTKGNAHVTELLNRLIYQTPQRGRYVRTRELRNNARVRLRSIASGPALYIVSYAWQSKFVEYGTREGLVSQEEVLRRAREAAAQEQELVIIEYGRVSLGLEPRPFVYPTLAYLERELPAEVARVVRETVTGSRGGRRGA